MSEVPGLRFEKKAWGSVAHVFTSDKAATSWLRVTAGTRCSRHFHRERVNSFAVLSGVILIEEWGPGLRAETTRLEAGQSHSVPSGVVHRFRVLESGEVVEIYWPDKDGGRVRIDDIERFDEGGRDDG